ncbi:DUF6375 family protein [Streptomyces sp. NPDC096012]|uniref:DUF6375 family protein n=1 Tax=Streptomyces sp. NPDC096012 TaxID=3155684 RepID=UPI00336A3E9B
MFRASRCGPVGEVTTTTPPSRTTDHDVQGFLKVLLHDGAKVEVFSRHEWDEDAITRSDASNRSDGGSD